MSTESLVLKSKLPPRSGSVVLRQLNPIHKKRGQKVQMFLFKLAMHKVSTKFHVIMIQIDVNCWMQVDHAIL